MGYTTEFSGKINLSRKLTAEEYNQLIEYNEDPDVIEGDKPGSYMQWIPDESLQAIVWDGEEKFYCYVEWLEWLMALLLRKDIIANGDLIWNGESTGDVGKITVVNNAVAANKL
jgi:hypothetical protein